MSKQETSKNETEKDLSEIRCFVENRKEGALRKWWAAILSDVRTKKWT